MDGAQAKRGVGRLGEVGSPSSRPWCVLGRLQRHVPQWKHPGRPLVPGSNPAVRAAGAAARAKASNRGWQPPVERGRWWGALLQVAGLIFLFISYVASQPRSASARQGYSVVCLKEAKAGGAPVPGRARPVGGSTATGRVQTGDLCHDKRRWLPLGHTASLTTLSTTKTQLQVSSLALYLLRSGLPPTASLSLSRAPSLSHEGGARDVRCVSIPRGVRTHRHRTEEVPYTCCAMTSCYRTLVYTFSTSTLHRLTRRPCAAWDSAPGTEPGPPRIPLPGARPLIPKTDRTPPRLLVLRYCYH